MKLNVTKAITGAIAGGSSGGWAGAAAGGAAGLFSPDEAADAKSAYNRQLNDSIMLWNMVNAYNTPLQQRKRYEEAGLNYNLLYDQGNSGNSSTISQPNLSYAQGGNSPLQKVLNSLSVKNAKAETKSNELDNEYKELRLEYLKAQIAKALNSNAKNIIKDDKAPSGSMTNINTYLWLVDKFGDWAKSKHLDQLDKRAFQWFMGDKEAFTKDFLSE